MDTQETAANLGLLSKSEAESWMEKMKNPPRLHPDLKPYVSRGTFFPVLKHPLVFAVPYTPGMSEHYNACLEYKTKRLAEAADAKEWDTYIFLHERPHRWDALLHIMDKMTDEVYWRCLGSIWSDTENLWQVQNILPYLLTLRKKGRNQIMRDDEKSFLETLPNEFRVFRGHQHRNRRGYSWSLSYWRACWFAQRWQSKRQGVSTGVVNKQDIIGVFLGRNEFEIAVDPKKVQNLHTLAKIRRPPWMKIVLEDAWGRFKLNRVSSHHGLWHWDKVERNALTLCKVVKGADPLVCRLFAILHDAERVNEMDDPEHGPRAADYIVAKLLGKSGVFDLSTVLVAAQVACLLEAVRNHHGGRISGDPTVGVCWDADRLDLSRVGTVPDPALLSTEPAKELIWRI